ncbi:PREDICTED: aquaporin-2-like isoform X2 [Thamnophis sirtalis]|uniref:Aquaporin-2-like isoform X2 n=1 Tax=Thamnophis sirtalis TaxID=35019 RepID=A0A6I9Z699_9SAUR|nr:PREDICTED: aquaporin-2-like isoform X2 [Thamnophis sirtalis]
MCKELASIAFYRAVFAELLITAIYVFFGLGSVLDWPETPSILQTAITFNLAAAVAVQIAWQVSGAHINPAVTVAFLLGSRVSLVRTVCYVVAQLAGGIVGAAVLYAVTPGNVRGNMGINKHYYTRCSMNPARSFGPAVITGDFLQQWIFWVGPLIGAVLASVLYNFVIYYDHKPFSQRLSILKGSYDGEELKAQEENAQKETLSLPSLVHRL